MMRRTERPIPQCSISRLQGNSQRDVQAQIECDCHTACTVDNEQSAKITKAFSHFHSIDITARNLLTSYTFVLVFRIKPPKEVIFLFTKLDHCWLSEKIRHENKALQWCWSCNIGSGYHALGAVDWCFKTYSSNKASTELLVITIVSLTNWRDM